ncbi:MAG: hypothetical protein AAF726_09460 [Planctomycetota bacterium]
MDQRRSTTIAAELKDALGQTAEAVSIDPNETLVHSVEWVLFDSALIAPAASVSLRALQRLTHQDGIADLEDDEFVRRWLGEVKAQVLAFLNRPEEWNDAGSLQFMEDCGSVFGVNDDRVPLLLQCFAGLSKEQRYGIFIAIERSRPFRYLTREIDADTQHRELENPTQSLRLLIRTVFEKG